MAHTRTVRDWGYQSMGDAPPDRSWYSASTTCQRDCARLATELGEANAAIALGRMNVLHWKDGYAAG
jgi:hypothetical protein